MERQIQTETPNTTLLVRENENEAAADGDDNRLCRASLISNDDAWDFNVVSSAGFSDTNSWIFFSTALTWTENTELNDKSIKENKNCNYLQHHHRRRQQQQRQI